MKLNNKGFAISTIMYLILVLAVILITATLLILSNRKIIVDKQKSEVLNSIYKICRPVKEEEASKKTDGTLIGSIPKGYYNAGDEYICNVDGSTEYHFYVLSKNGDYVNLILDRTINSSGELSIEQTDSVSEWYDGDDVTNGPITAFNFLYSATSDWFNIPSMSIDYNYLNSIAGFKTIGKNVTMINSTGFESATYKNLKARLPFEYEVESVGCNEDINSCPLWLSNYLNPSSNVTGGNNIPSLVGYWLIPDEVSNIYLIDFEGRVVESLSYGGFTNKAVIGVRPVITLLKSNFSE